MMEESGIRDLLVEIKTRLDILVLQHGDHETRLRVLERTRWIAVGAAVAAGGAAGKFAGLL